MVGLPVGDEFAGKSSWKKSFSMRGSDGTDDFYEVL